jgi:hypothetical protein
METEEVAYTYVRNGKEYITPSINLAFDRGENVHKVYLRKTKNQHEPFIQ